MKKSISILVCILFLSSGCSSAGKSLVASGSLALAGVGVAGGGAVALAQPSKPGSPYQDGVVWKTLPPKNTARKVGIGLSITGGVLGILGIAFLIAAGEQLQVEQKADKDRFQKAELETFLLKIRVKELHKTEEENNRVQKELK